MNLHQHGGRELLQAALSAQGFIIKLPELKAEAGKPQPSMWARWRQRRSALQQARRLTTPVDQLHSLYYDFLEHLRAVTGRNPKALALHRERLRYRGLGWWPRLLWRLRGKTEVVASHPDDVSFDVILPMARRTLQKDYDRHRVWLVVDLVLLVVSGVLALVPGPNVLAYFFAFRVVGHWLSMRGARQGLHRARWVGRACPILTRLRGATELPAAARTARIQEAASQLGVDRLPRFVERMRHRR